MPARKLLISLALASACTAATAPALEETAPTIDPPVLAPPSAAATMPSIEPTEVDTLDGVVHEIQSVGHYTYVRVGPAGTDGDWAVVMGVLDTAPGDAITLSVQGSQDDFHSRRLDRDFERLFFASVPSHV